MLGLKLNHISKNGPVIAVSDLHPRTTRLRMFSYSSNIFIDKASIYFRRLYLLRVHAWSKLCAIWQGAHSTPVLSSMWSKLHKMGIIMYPLLLRFAILSSLVTWMIAFNNDINLKWESILIRINTITFALDTYLNVCKIFILPKPVFYNKGQQMIAQMARVFGMNPKVWGSSQNNNICSWVKNECCHSRTLNISNANFTT